MLICFNVSSISSMVIGSEKVLSTSSLMGKGIWDENMDQSIVGGSGGAMVNWAV
jgi:hypothetical protein